MDPTTSAPIGVDARSATRVGSDASKTFSTPLATSASKASGSETMAVPPCRSGNARKVTPGAPEAPTSIDATSLSPGATTSRWPPLTKALSSGR